MLLNLVRIPRRIASSWIYAVSVTGVTGARANLASDLPEFLKRIREHSSVRTITLPVQAASSLDWHDPLSFLNQTVCAFFFIESRVALSRVV
jgi:hypothetical protein